MDASTSGVTVFWSSTETRTQDADNSHKVFDKMSEKVIESFPHPV